MQVNLQLMDTKWITIQNPHPISQARATDDACRAKDSDFQKSLLVS
jgi:hypothetical protein